MPIEGIQRVTPENWAEGADAPPHTPLPGVLPDAAKLRGSEGMEVLVPSTSTGDELDREVAAAVESAEEGGDEFGRQLEEELAEMAEDQEGIEDDPEWARREGSTQWCILKG